MARLLAIDYGKKRCGIAVTDNSQIIAYGLDFVETKYLMDFLKNYFSNEQVEAIILGCPTKADGTPADICMDIEQLVSILQKKYPEKKIFFQDENYTSKKAVEEMLKAGVKKKKRRQKGNIDKMSAAIILQEFLKSVGKW